MTPLNSDTIDLLKTDFLTVSEIATVTRVSKMTVYRLVKDGAFPNATRIGGVFRVPSSDLRNYLRECGVRIED